MGSVYEYECSEEFLSQTLKKISDKNSSFSLRSFSRHLGVSPSHMSRLLKGSNRMSPSLARQVASRLKMSPSATEYFCLLVQMENAKSESHRKEMLRELSLRKRHLGKSVVKNEVFKMISDWHHAAIIVLAKTKGFEGDAKWVSRRLGVSAIKAEIALKRLLELGFLKKDLDGKIRTGAGPDLTTSGDIVSAAIKDNHRQQLALAKEALDSQPIDMREFMNVTLSMDSEKVKKAKTLIRDFIDKFNAEMDIEGSADVFQLNMQFFKLTKP
ncbi:MAG: DUF4423 domain-containing protein [Bdellovibrionales bacterium]|nr:DUF4423 domain-containing protein [Bdellovibrionales bacterium]